ncbi:MAG: hypothetical protein M3Q72_02110 [Actinomycetota bacterium]|nr:hypothetical protein [Actinomycetota bacterium]
MIDAAPELPDGIFRLPADTGERGAHAYLIDADEPLLFGFDLGLPLDALVATLELVMPCERLRWLCPARPMDADEVQRVLAAMPAVGLLCGVDSRLSPMGATTSRVRVVEPDEHVELGGRTVMLEVAAALGGSGSVTLTELVTGTMLSELGVIEPVGTAAQYPPPGGCASQA